MPVAVGVGEAHRFNDAVREVFGAGLYEGGLIGAGVLGCVT